MERRTGSHVRIAGAQVSFSSDIRKFSKKAEGNMDRVAKKIAITAFRRVILRTPVDTGRARGNWFCGNNIIPTQTDNSAIDKSGSKAISDMTNIVTSSEIGVVLTLANNLPYIRKLEYGHSKQAPQGMVRLTVEELNQIVGDSVKMI